MFPHSEIIASLRPHGKKGGIATIISKEYAVKKSLRSEYGVAVHICNGTINVLIANIYIPPESSKYAPSTLDGYEECLGEIQAWISA